MPGLFSRVRQSLSSSSPQPPRAQTAADQTGSNSHAHPGAAGQQDQKTPDARQSELEHERELQQALEASELEEALAQSRLAAETQLYSGSPTPAPLESSASDDEQLKEAMALSEAEARKADKGKGVMKRTPTEEDIERALQESAQLASTSPKRKPQHYGSPAPHIAGQGSSQSQPDKDAADAELDRALYESQQLAASPSAPAMPSPAAAVQHAPLPSSSPHPARLTQAPPAHHNPQDSSVRYPQIFQPGSSSSSSQTASSSQSPQLQPPRNRDAPHHHQQSQQLPQQQPGQTRQLPSGGYQHQHQHQQAAPSGRDSGLYIDGHHGSANLESMLSADEAFAKALQDAEYQAATAGQAQQASRSPQPQPQRQQPSPGQHQHQQERQRQAGSSQPPAPHQSVNAKSGTSTDKPGMCAGCGRSLTVLGFGGMTVSVMGRTWHAACMKCGACQQQIPAGVQLGMGKEDGLPYHLTCYHNKFDPRCTVCHEVMPVGQDNIIRFNINAFWKEKTCPKHQDDDTPQCCSCSRRCPRGEQWVEELDGRIVCLGCLSTIVRDTQDAQPLYDEVLSFYQHMGMALPEKPPLMMVESSALNEAEEREGRSGGGHRHGPVFHTRGLTLTVEYRAIQQVVTRDGRRFTQPVDLSARDRYEVTAILVLYGLPWLLTGTILAHECMHAWLRLRGITRLPLQTEEGLCQLMGLLWLESQDLSRQQGTWEERLASYFAHQIRTDPSTVYGDGFKLALEAYQNSRDLPALIAHVERTGQFPV